MTSKQSSKQASKHTHAQRNEVTLVWGSLTLAPIIITILYYSDDVVERCRPQFI